MKNILTLLFLVPFIAFTQVDSAQLKVTVTLQARDAEYIGFFIGHNIDYEDLFDALKAKFRVTSPPAGTTNVTVDTIAIAQWLGVSAKLRTDPYAIGGSVFSRIDASLRAVNHAYLTGRLNVMDSEDAGVFTNFRLLGRFKLRKQ
jgi:hypothetical protein